jgi:hypothetical protein
MHGDFYAMRTILAGAGHHARYQHIQGFSCVASITVPGAERSACLFSRADRAL